TLLPILEQRQQSLLKAGDVTGEVQVKQCVMELLALRRMVNGDYGLMPHQRLVARRSAKLIPELLFDNTRLSCCLFKPNGLFHGEIVRLALDPATPILEFWLDPHPEFLGLATYYVGRNARGERTVLMDTIDYNDSLLELRGYSGTMRFMLDAIALDAYLAKTEKLLVFAAPWGKPLGFANSVRQIAERNASIRYLDSYYFEAIDPQDSALSLSRYGRHHYTESFGYERPMIGAIDYPYSLIGYGTVEKLLSGGRGVYEIDVAEYVHDHPVLVKHVEAALLRPLAAIGETIFRPPPHHAEEIRALNRGPSMSTCIRSGRYCSSPQSSCCLEYPRKRRRCCWKSNRRPFPRTCAIRENISTSAWVIRGRSYW
ncbi:MAG: hypothetical protein ACRD7E_12660, partial [Bryobacteraceae bacterium]